MATGNRDRVSKGFGVLSAGLLDFVDQPMIILLGKKDFRFTGSTVDWNNKWKGGSDPR